MKSMKTQANLSQRRRWWSACDVLHVRTRFCGWRLLLFVLALQVSSNRLTILLLPLHLYFFRKSAGWGKGLRPPLSRLKSWIKRLLLFRLWRKPGRCKGNRRCPIWRSKCCSILNSIVTPSLGYPDPFAPYLSLVVVELFTCSILGYDNLLLHSLFSIYIFVNQLSWWFYARFTSRSRTSPLPSLFSMAARRRIAFEEKVAGT